MNHEPRKKLPTRDELQAILAILPSLNHYQLLKVSPAAQVSEIQSAFHREALLFHPDRYQGKGRTDSVEEARQIYLKIVAAYNALSNREQRSVYDQQLKAGGAGQAPSAVDSKAAATADLSVATPKKPQAAGPGIKFFKLAQSAFQSGNRGSAKLNIQLALNMEPENTDYKKFADRIASLK